MHTATVPSTPRPAGIRHREADRRGDPRRSIGQRGEQLAADHLRALGFSTLWRNVRTRFGEIDLIGFDGRTLVFAEVKTLCIRAGSGPLRADPRPLMWLHRAQRRRLRRLAAAWLSSDTRVRPTARAIRFDAIGVTVDGAGGLRQIEHFEGAW